MLAIVVFPLISNELCNLSQTVNYYYQINKTNHYNSIEITTTLAAYNKRIKPNEIIINNQYFEIIEVTTSNNDSVTLLVEPDYLDNIICNIKKSIQSNHDATSNLTLLSWKFLPFYYEQTKGFATFISQQKLEYEQLDCSLLFSMKKPVIEPPQQV
jgi:hypothetical protein